MEIDLDELAQLVAARGPPGDEYDVAKTFEELVRPHVDRVEWDELGNVIATDEGSEDAPEIMLAAHTDELAFLIDEVRDDGLLSLTMMGGHYKGYLAGQSVLVGPDEVPGVIGAKPRHYMSNEEKESLPETLHVDVGASSAAEVAELNVEPGDHATWDRELTELNHGKLAGRALDDRLFLAVLLAVARDVETDATVHYAATVQEEVGLRGARTAGYSVDPDVAIALDIFPADDYPIDGESSATVELGSGPVVEFGDGTSEYLFGGVLVDRQTREWLDRAADDAAVGVQHGVMIGGTTDATQLQGVRGGRHAGALGVPCRYTHSPVETVDLDDVDGMVETLRTALSTPFPDRTDVRGR